MSWQNGNNGGGRNQRPAPGKELEELIAHGQQQLRQFVPKGGSSMPIIFALVALIAIGAWTAYYTVPSDSVAVVQRFGKYLKNVSTGLHFKLPMGIDTATVCT